MPRGALVAAIGDKTKMAPFALHSWFSYLRSCRTLGLHSVLEMAYIDNGTTGSSSRAMRRLDPAQSAAAADQAAIQLTLAGPGSGKTSTLTGRFVHLVRQDVNPARILAVTFTKKAADEMRRRIVRLLELPS